MDKSLNPLARLLMLLEALLKQDLPAAATLLGELTRDSGGPLNGFSLLDGGSELIQSLHFNNWTAVMRHLAEAIESARELQGSGTKEMWGVHPVESSSGAVPGDEAATRVQEGSNGQSPFSPPRSGFDLAQVASDFPPRIGSVRQRYR